MTVALLHFIATSVHVEKKKKIDTLGLKILHNGSDDIVEAY